MLSRKEKSSSVWVFGYGSLIWKPNFNYTSKRIGYICGFSRKFWQGNVTHRGSPGQPGRVATLVVSDATDEVWGVAYEVSEENLQTAFSHLLSREVDQGGYTTITTSFTPRDEPSSPVSAICFTASPDNRYFLGPVGVNQLAAEVASALGPAGSNAEYVFRLTDYIRQHIPEDKDQHLFSLESRLKEMLLLDKGRLHGELPAAAVRTRFPGSLG